MALIIPKCNAEPETLDLTLKVYYNADGWLENADLIDRLSSALIDAGIETEKKEPQSYTKKTQVLSYYGLIEWEDETNNQSRRRITESGKKFYELRTAHDLLGIQKLLLQILNNNTFGRNVLGCDSDSDIEAPNVFLKSTLILGTLTNKEFAFIVGEMELRQRDFADVLFEVFLKRKNGETVAPGTDAAKWADPKPIIALADWGIFEVTKSGGAKYYSLSNDFVKSFSSQLSTLRTKNTETKRFSSTYGNSQSRKEAFHSYLLNNAGISNTSSAEHYYRDIVKDIVNNEVISETNSESSSIFDIDNIQAAKRIEENVKANPENRDSFSGYPGAACSHYVGFLKYLSKNSCSNDVLRFTEKPLQKITYGAPGTGKSHAVNVDTKGQAVIRTTFHPDSDYSTFVGAYKPTMTKVRKCIVIDKEEREITPLAENSEYERKIQYSFVKQAFLKAYLGAWKKFTEPKTDDEGKEVILPQFLVIEEINRGNCAQIFGDLFQLLDRDDNKFSSYPIEADADLQQEIANAFENDPLYKLTNKINVEGIIKDYTSNYADENGNPCTLSNDIQSGRVLLLPKNLYIWATMNTSDQSLFPIDSAFKRRWVWEYVRISEGHDKQNNNEPLRWYIAIKDEQYDWWSFLNKINERIGSITSSEDKKLGYFFCKAEDGKISAEKFVSKVCFYLWNDVFKDFGFGKKDQSAAFKKENGKDIAFDDFYTEDPETFKSKVNEDLLETFMQKLEVDTVAKRLEKENKAAENNNNAPQQNEVPTE